MSQHDDKVSLRHMLDHAREAVGLARDKNQQDIERDRVLQLALVRLVEVVGEAAGRVTTQGREKYSTLPWKGIISMRNRLIHGYDVINLQLLWDTLDSDLPRLIRELERILVPPQSNP